LWIYVTKFPLAGMAVFKVKTVRIIGLFIEKPADLQQHKADFC
jgi:hypothetical protein